MNKQQKKEDRIRDLIKMCRYYKGETSAPSHLSQGQQQCWILEKEWTELLADSFTNRDKLLNYIETRFGGNNLSICKELNMPRSLLAYIISKYDSSMFAHEWIFEPFLLLSGTYCNISPDLLMQKFLTS